MAALEGNQGIYKITSPTGRVYIGQSSNILARFSRYRGLHCVGQRRLYASLKKHGVESHAFEVIEVVHDESDMVEKERYWQEFYEVVGPKGLNCKIVTNDCHAGRHSPQTRALMSAAARGRRPSKEARDKMRAAKSGRRMPEEQRLAMVGRKLPPETIEKMRARMAGNQYTKGITPKNAKRVICEKTGKIFMKVEDAASFLGMKRSTLAAKLRGQSRNDTRMRFL